MIIRVLLLLTSIVGLLAATGWSQGQAGGQDRVQSPGRVWPRDRLGVHAASAAAPAEGTGTRGRANATGATMRPGENLRWLPPEERSDRLAQLPTPRPYVPATPAQPPWSPGPQAVPPMGPTLPPNGFHEATPPSWATPGYWLPNPMATGEPQCPPYWMPPNGYGYGPPCPPPMLPVPPLMPPPQPGMRAPPAVAEPQYSNVPLLPPNLLGSLFGGEPQQLTLSFEHQFHTRGAIVSGTPGSPSAVLAFERNGGFPNDFNSVPGTGRDVTGDGFADTFDMTEPLPPNEVPISPGPGYAYDGGAVAYTNSPTTTNAQDGQFQDNELWFAQYSFSKSLEIPAAGALSVRRMYVAQNNSPIPRDRIFVDFRQFSDARLNLGDVTWGTFGLEKTFHLERGSIEARLPFARSLDNEVFEDDPIAKSTELGNLNFTLKHILWGNERWLFTGGAAVSVPTGAPTRVFLADGTEVLVIDNDAVHVQPFIAALWLPEEHFFVQSFVSADFDTRGNNVRGNINGGRLPTIGEYRSASLLMADLATGYWIYTNPSFRAALQGLALVGELQYQTTLEDTDSVSGNGLTVTGGPQDLETYSVTLGIHGYLFNQIAVSGGIGLPLSQDDQQEYDSVAILMLNWHF